jgi:hypothetical protein
MKILIVPTTTKQSYGTNNYNNNNNKDEDRDKDDNKYDIISIITVTKQLPPIYSIKMLQKILMKTHTRYLQSVDRNIWSSKIGNVNCKLMCSQSLTVTKQLPELEASLEVSFSFPNFELSSTIAASGT